MNVERFWPARVTDEFTAETVPAGLRRAHRIAAGSVRFVLEDEPDRRVLVEAGQDCVIEPGVLHHVEPSADARFVVEFYQPASERRVRRRPGPLLCGSSSWPRSSPPAPEC